MNAKTEQKVDRYSPMPVYQQIANDIITRINQAEWGIGDKLPSENELSEEYDASRVTIRQALAKLESDGLIDKQRGRGAFLKSNPRRLVQELYLPQIGIQHQSDTKSERPKFSIVTHASAQVYNSLGLDPGTPLVYLERLFTRKRRAIGVNRAWFPLSMVPDMADEGLIDNSITGTLQERYNIHFSSVENYIESIMLDAATAQQLETITPSPGLKISSIYTIKHGVPVEYSITIWNGRDTQFHVSLSSD